MLNKTNGKPKQRNLTLSCSSRIVEVLIDKKYYDVCLSLIGFYSAIETLKILFASGDDFRNYMDVINRNYLSHGMATRTLNKIDCIQIFLTLYYIVDYYESNNFKGLL